MDDILALARAEIERYLADHLTQFSEAWWKEYVVDRLTFSQQRVVEERRLRSHADVDLSALLRVLDQNWFELSQNGALHREARAWIKELQTVRNKWAHRSSQVVPATETYRDVDTVARLLNAIGADQSAPTLE